ncbi:MAG: MmgE/PrpD family protein, partial [Gammaproteobacteria bacterium]|nr:MmgE/PrpD family protein [Gammaproteobacteria bacterium]
RGWHTTVTLGGIGATDACARLVGLATDSLACALSLAASMSSGLTNQVGFSAKQLHAGLATQLAAAGVTGSDQALDGPVSLATAMGDYDKPRFERALNKLGHPWSILEHGLHQTLSVLRLHTPGH